MPTLLRIQDILDDVLLEVRGVLGKGDPEKAPATAYFLNSNRVRNPHHVALMFCCRHEKGTRKIVRAREKLVQEMAFHAEEFRAAFSNWDQTKFYVLTNSHKPKVVVLGIWALAPKEALDCSDTLDSQDLDNLTESIYCGLHARLFVLKELSDGSTFD